MEIKPYSASMLKLIDHCLASFFLRYIQRKKQTLNAPGEIGSNFHKIVEEYNRYLWETKQKQDMLKLDFLVNKYMRPEEANEIKYLIQRYVDTHLFDDFGKEVHFEKKLAIKEDLQPSSFDSKESWIRGVVDRLTIDGEVATVIDWKTSRIVPEPQQWENDIQKKIYVLLVAKNWPQLKRINIEFHFIRYNVVLKDSFEISNLKLRPIVDLIQAKEERIKELLEEYKKNPEKWNRIFTARPGGFCMLCGVWYECPLENDNPYLEVAKDPAKAAGMVEFYKKKARELEKAVKAYIGEFGPIDLGEDVAEFRLYKNAEVINSQEFVRRLVKQEEIPKEEVWDYIKIPKTTVEKIQREYGLNIIRPNGTIAEEWEDIVLPKFNKKYGIYKKTEKYPQKIREEKAEGGE